MEPRKLGPSDLSITPIGLGAWAIADRRRETVAQRAIAWVLRRPEVTSVIVGARQPSEIVEDMDASDFRLSAEELAEIDELVQRRERMLEPARS